MKAIRKIIDSIAVFLCSLSFAILTFLVTWQVVTRRLLNSPSAWTEQLSRYIFVWVVLLNAAYIFGKREHMNITFLIEKLSKKRKAMMGILTETIILLFALFVLVYGGSQAVKIAMPQTDSAMPFLKMGFVYMAMPVSGIFTTFYSMNNIMDLIKEIKDDRKEQKKS